MYWNSTLFQWDNYGCAAHPNSSYSATQCVCDHLTEFSILQKMQDLAAFSRFLINDTTMEEVEVSKARKRNRVVFAGGSDESYFTAGLLLLLPSFVSFCCRQGKLGNFFLFPVLFVACALKLCKIS